MTENSNTGETHKEPENPGSQGIVGIRFRSCGKIYSFSVDNIEVAPGSRVVVDSEMGLSLGHVATPRQVREKTKDPLKKVLRLATEKDFETAKNNRSLEDEARLFCIEKVKSLNLPMKIVTTETTLDRKRLIFYFTADGRIDFRELVRDLAAKFKTRIEMRQIGVRDEVKLLGGFGCCGRQTCCSLFLTSFAPITIRMAKEQDLSINQSKLSGICGRLMCCLGYEYKEYAGQEAAALSQDDSLVTITEDTPVINMQEVDTVSISEDTESEQTEKALQRNVPFEGKSGSLPSQKEKLSEKADEKKTRFRGNRRRRKKPRPEKATPESTVEKKQGTRPPDRTEQREPRPADKTEQGEPKSKGKPFNRRRKFWKKKKQ